MRLFELVFSPEAENQLESLYRYIAERASPDIALRFTNAIFDHSETFKSLPHRGTSRNDIRQGLRVTHYRGRVVIAYTVVGEQVAILGIFYGGQDFEAMLSSEPS